MKISTLAALLALTAASPGFAQETKAPAKTVTSLAAEPASDEFTQVTEPKINGWGKVVDPGKDCKFFLSKSALIISTPASDTAHDFSPELNLTNAPRVDQPVEGDFTFQVQVDDRLHPGDETNLPGRTGYNGAAAVAIADGLNVVTLARAALKTPGDDAVPYANFEIRVNGELKRIGLTDDCPLPKSGPVQLRLERHGQQITGSVSTDGTTWNKVGTETIPDDWNPKLKVGVMVVNSSKGDFSPQFSKLQLTK